MLLDASRGEVTISAGAAITDLTMIEAAVDTDDWHRVHHLLASSERGLLTDLDGLDEQLDDWLRLERAHVPARTLRAVLNGAARCAAERGAKVGLEIVNQVLRLDPTNEEATRLAMRLAAERGDAAAVHRYFAALRTQLRDEFDAHPAAETLATLRRYGKGQALTSDEESDPPSIEQSPIHSPPYKAGAKIRWALALFLVASILAAALILPWRSGSVATQPKTFLAVLPFEESLSDQESLAVGIGEQTRGMLTGNPGFLLLGRATTEAAAAQRLIPSEYRRRFGVTHLLEGTVNRAGHEIVASVSLTRTSDGAAVWHGTFRSRSDSRIAPQVAIAGAIEGALRGRLAPGGGRKAEQIATSPEVYASFSEARQLISERESQGVRRAESLLRDAVAQDPNYAPAWALLGIAISFNNQGVAANNGAHAEALSAVQRSLSLAPNFALAHAALALAQGEQSQAAEASLRRAIALDPGDSDALTWLGNSLSAQGRMKEAAAFYEEAIRIDPLLYPAVQNLAQVASDLGDSKRIDRLIDSTRRAGASEEFIDSLNVRRLYLSGDFSQALALLKARGLDGSGRARPLLWAGWFDTLTATGSYSAMHRITGCPSWYAPLLRGETIAPQWEKGKPVAPEIFWTSQFFSAPAARAMVRLHHGRDLVVLYRRAFRDADEFISRVDRRAMLPELASNLALALEANGLNQEADYLLSASAQRMQRAIANTPDRSSLARLAMIRGAQHDAPQALALLDEATRKGWFPDGHTVALDLAQEPAFGGLSGNGRFEAIRKHILAQVEHERAEIGPLPV
ncbi:tetratricopeptide repeat protein [Sphingomonas sp. KRR8]|uniref:tetratricopeptide repeat protein n=1 Tax=Sphingomonas sp. KRR8 TaxID=2942996 RepID=UPI002020835B|nr:tetratricopeptide repeat protein [Sphingomonas sp. KRR8]URD60731.1 tetratricopeptide repeat protein [Sphingomonas sp. KRR8]